MNHLIAKHRNFRTLRRLQFGVLIFLTKEITVRNDEDCLCQYQFFDGLTSFIQLRVILYCGLTCFEQGVQKHHYF